MTNFFQKLVVNRLMRRNPPQTLLETTGRTSGQPRRAPLGGELVRHQFRYVSEFGAQSQYVRNIQADPRVRVRRRGTWRSGTNISDGAGRPRLNTTEGRSLVGHQK